MTFPDSDLRIQIAQFNNFIIRNYTIRKVSELDSAEPKKFLFEMFSKLAAGLGECGAFLGKTNDLDHYEQHASLVKDLLNDAIVVIYLIEKSAGEDELVSAIQSINSFFLRSVIDKINTYASEFETNADEVETELSQLITDNPEYFDLSGTLKQAGNIPSVAEATAYLADNTHLISFKKKFADAANLSSYFSEYNGNGNIETFLNNGLKVIYFVLLAMTYVEPFYEVSQSVNDEFASGVTQLFKSQAAAVASLS